MNSGYDPLILLLPCGTCLNGVLCNASVNSSCAHPPPGQLRGICAPCQFRGWGTARGTGICLPRGYPRGFDTLVVSDSKSKHGGFYRRGPAIRCRLIDRHGLDKLVEVFSILCISSLLIKAQLELSLYIARLETINVNRRTHASLIEDLNKI